MDICVMSEINHLLAVKIRRLRKNKGLSQEKFALLAEIDRTYMQSIEKGERNISVATAAKISSALGISLSELFSDL
mgnify:CR=1 FL=1